MRRLTNSRGALIALIFLATVGMAACSANHAPSAARPGNGHSATAPIIPTAAATPAATATPAAAPAASAAPSPTSGFTFVPIQDFPDGAFYSPSGNISCDLNYQLDGQTVTDCMTIAPRVSVQMGVTGEYEIVCTGQQCGPLSPQPEPTLAYGTATSVGPFVCESATTGVTCTADGRGFQISRSGITPV